MALGGLGMSLLCDKAEWADLGRTLWRSFSQSSQSDTPFVDTQNLSILAPSRDPETFHNLVGE